MFTCVKILKQNNLDLLGGMRGVAYPWSGGVQEVVFSRESRKILET